MSDIFFSVAGAALALFIFAVVFSMLRDSIEDSRDRKLKRREFKEAELIKINQENLDYQEKIRSLNQRIYELEATIKTLNQAEWRDQYFDLQGLYYKLLLEYKDDPSANCAEDLFPIEEKRLSAVQLHYALADEKKRRETLEERLSGCKSLLDKSEKKVGKLKVKVDELETTCYELSEYKIRLEDLKESLPLSHLIKCSGVEAYSEALDSTKGNKAISGDIVVQEVFWADNPGHTPPKQICAKVYSRASDKTYRTTLTDCDCPNHQISASKNKHYVCKHMLALALTLKLIPIDFK